MSSDNGYIIRKHPDGGFCAVDYSMSLYMENGYKTPDGYPYPSGREQQFATINEAFERCDNADFLDGYYSEYGVHIDEECRKLQRELRSQLHLIINVKDGEVPSICSCGYSPPNDKVPMLSLYQHQANSLRVQLIQLQ